MLLESMKPDLAFHTPILLVSESAETRRFIAHIFNHGGPLPAKGEYGPYTFNPGDWEILAGYVAAIAMTFGAKRSGILRSMKQCFEAWVEGQSQEDAS